jgi:hypothetical protein
MMYHLGNRFVLANIECVVAFIDSRGYAHVSPVEDGDEYHGDKLYKGLVFAVLDRKGKDLHGEKAIALPSLECGAV